MGIGGALGLPLGGLLFQQFGWPSVFWVSVAVGLAIGVAVLSVVPESAVKTRGRFDLLGAVMLSVALTSLLLAISKGGTWGWGSERTLLLLGLTVVVLAVWFPYSLRVSQPLVDLRTSARRPVLLTNIASILVGFALMANILISTQQLQQPVAGSGFGLTAVGAGLAMIPSGLAMVAFSPVSGAMINRLGGRVTLMAGTLIMGVGYIGRVFNTDTLAALIVGSTVVSIGSAVAYAAMPSLIMANVPITETASANGLNALLRALGTSTASAAIAALLSLVTDHRGHGRTADRRRLPGRVLARRGRGSGGLRRRLVRTETRPRGRGARHRDRDRHPRSGPPERRSTHAPGGGDRGRPGR